MILACLVVEPSLGFACASSLLVVKRPGAVAAAIPRLGIAAATVPNLETIKNEDAREIIRARFEHQARIILVSIARQRHSRSQRTAVKWMFRRCYTATVKKSPATNNNMDASEIRAQVNRQEVQVVVPCVRELQDFSAQLYVGVPAMLPRA